MNVWQAVRQVQYQLREAEWTAGVPVFAPDSVVIAIQDDDDFYSPQRSPTAIVSPLDGLDDEEDPNLKAQSIGVRLIVVNAHDQVGEAALIGANRVGQTDSRGRGILELEEKLFDAVALLDRGQAFRIQLTTGGAGRAEIRDDLYVCVRDYELAAVVTADRSYAPPRKAAASVAGPTVTLTWTNPGSRFDFVENVVRRASGSTPPASPTDGTGVVLGIGLIKVETVDDSPGSGTWSYSIFAGYDEYGADASNRYSAPNSVASVVVA